MAKTPATLAMSFGPESYGRIGGPSFGRANLVLGPMRRGGKKAFFSHYLERGDPSIKSKSLSG
jgi:hypothetical protein